ncbi:unnamed protein product, partial [Vitis vinifera]
MVALRDAKINKIGVWGLGGVGKTTLVKQVAEQAAQEKLFDKVVTAAVLETPDLKKIQGELADLLGMKFEEESEQGRAARLYQRMNEEKTILIILDDIWAKLDLEKIGIPSPDHHKGCKLVLTSRNEHILSNEMDTQKDFRVQPLQEDETWILFKNTAGSIENPELQPIAVDVAKECAGLPLAIVTVAKALKNKNVSIWKDALQQLKSQTLTNVTGLTTNVYSSLKLSYEHLKGVEVKSFFLLCGLISQNDISIRDLLKYGVGLRLFQGTNTLEEAKNRIDALVDNLKSSNFLLETGHNAFVRMHDLVRSTARKIASDQHHVFTLQNTTVRVEGWPRIDELQKVTWVSLHDCDIRELPEGLACPKLELFGLENCDKLEQVFDLEELNVDDGHVGLLPKLGKLRLIDLPKLRHICNCGSSRNHFPSSMASAPVGNIIFPKLFYISLGFLPNLTSFVSPGYHSLQRLHHADLDTPFPVLFDERVAFPSLNFLFIGSLDNVKKIWPNQIPQDSFSKLEKVVVASCGQLLNIFPSCMLKRLQSLQFLRAMECSSLEAVFDVEGTNVNVDCSSLGNTNVFPKITCLDLRNLPQLRSFYPGAHTSQWPLLEELRVSECYKLDVFAFETPTFQQRHGEGNLDMPLFFLPHVAFPNLEELRLGDNRDTEIWPEQFPVDSFPRLRVLHVHDYRDILVVIPSFMLQRLHNLEVLKVGSCSSVKEVFQLEGLDEENQAKRLGRLREIELHDLPGLTRLWKENSEPGLDLQSLESLEVWNCGSLINLVPSSVSFQNLATLDVQSCGSLRSLISPSVAKSLVKLKTLKIGRSDMMEEVVANEGGEATDEITFYKLQHMELLYLPNLTSFSSGGYIFSFPSLEQMLVKECPKMKMFSPSLVTPPRLKRIKVGDEEWPWQDDLNTAIHNSFINAHGMY